MGTNASATAFARTPAQSGLSLRCWRHRASAPKVMYRLIEGDHYVNQKILVVGEGDSAVEAAMGLTHRFEDFIHRSKIAALFNSNPVEVRSDSVVRDVRGKQQTIANDFVWIFAGGKPPTAFLKKIGVRFAERNLTKDGVEAVAQSAKENDSLVPA
jgi:thioredoxin reductase